MLLIISSLILNPVTFSFEKKYLFPPSIALIFFFFKSKNVILVCSDNRQIERSTGGFISISLFTRSLSHIFRLSCSKQQWTVWPEVVIEFILIILLFVVKIDKKQNNIGDCCFYTWET